VSVSQPDCCDDCRFHCREEVPFCPVALELLVGVTHARNTWLTWLLSSEIHSCAESLPAIQK
jgi:hypothetical protein